MFLPPRVRSTRQKSRHAQRSATLNALPLRLQQAKPFSVAAKKIRIGYGPRGRYGILQAKPFSLAAAKNRIGRGPRCRYDHCRRNFSPLHRFASLGLKSRITAAPRAFPGKSMQ